ncbi:protein kinase, putative [Entamoeba histolytica HM-1:IMSS-B]|uniref:Protein kinase, putative n=6 Tax=Entamoeba histolytica TaxID=5759 RepID=C4LVK5_ENTH1|nr:protein kinase, putative [Entamoeba histolytica HM-1:IMSS]EMD48205.1 serine/threonine protein kinase, putative [Entamoeba histolytica KU27]EMH72244.1 protein kinase, putative [Entamoeba histolytica HM-1:IMSS-B]EMS15307.1 serine/threonine protein kinase [Entamoeba histolytica HM-3:IMSS]ENY64894.1 serine/threonine protein kinase, putative [Entamoeba histolytica HM-1:IMSS-A]GAT92702.1 protein kinase putative [Entamoeba histolytica]|eukprot:XP_653371.1 protein kinase, putative [Entamoeba histolytica HM-1:IMSS]
MADEVPAKLDEKSQEILREYLATKQEDKTPLEMIYFDLAVGLREDETMEYRMAVVNFVERRFKLIRHGKVREEYPFTSLNTVTVCSSPTQFKMKLTLCEQPSILLLMQNESDFNSLFEILRTITTDNNSILFKEDFLQDYCHLVKMVSCKKHGKTFWARRSLNIYNGLIALYAVNGEIPLTILPFSDNVEITKHQRLILIFQCVIRRVYLRFETEEECNEVETLCKKCQQYYHKPQTMIVKDFFSGKLADLTPTCRELCNKNNLYPEECEKHFDTLCEILRSQTKKRYATVTEKRQLQQKIEHPQAHIEKPKKEPPPEEDDLLRYCKTEDPHKYFTNLVSIGKGGFGEVFCAQRIEDGKPIALKMLKHSVDERYTKIGAEVARLSNWKHPNIVGFEGCWLYNNQVYIGMEYCSLGTLKTLLKNRMRPFQDADTAFLLLETLKALKYIHEEGFIHRDIKTANIMLKQNFEIKVIDFGLVVRINSKPSNRAGSKAYMAPEVIKQIPYNEKVDIWSIGCVAQELFEGSPPYRELGMFKGLFKTATVGAPGLRNPSKAPPELVDFLKKCFFFNPEERWSATQLLEHPFLKQADGSIIKQRGMKVGI